jgi:hypothetical protein
MLLLARLSLREIYVISNIKYVVIRNMKHEILKRQLPSILPTENPEKTDV